MSNQGPKLTVGLFDFWYLNKPGSWFYLTAYMYLASISMGPFFMSIFYESRKKGMSINTGNDVVYDQPHT